jgi:hypothetical protein
MRKIVAGRFMSLDGVVEAPHRWVGPYWSDEMTEGRSEGIHGADAILIGTSTYLEFTKPQGAPTLRLASFPPVATRR